MKTKARKVHLCMRAQDHRLLSWFTECGYTHTDRVIVTAHREFVTCGQCRARWSFKHGTDDMPARP